ncbi:MAG: rhamnose transport system ATP-binding protein [Solirubrobacteraceae bacterium]
MPDGRPIALRLRGVSKTFPGVRALSDVDLDVRSGSVHALLGHNGCGKSTLVKALAGFHDPDGPCEAVVDGHELELGSPEAAERCGIRFVHQELGLIRELSVADNVAFAIGHGRRSRFAKINWRRQARVTEELLASFGIHLDPRAPLATATPVERAAVAIVRAVAGWERGRGLLVLDEPTAALPAREVDELFRLIREIRDSGTAVLLISHRLDEVMAICDHATVMRAGQVIWDGGTHDMSVREFAVLIAGTDARALDGAAEPAAGARLAEAPDALAVDGLTGRYLRDVSLSVRRGEIVGVAGLLGSGREELPYAVAGALGDAVEGSVRVDGRPLAELTLRAARAAGVVLVPADRSREGIVGEFSVRENVTLASLAGLRRHGILFPSRERAFAHRWLHAVNADVGVAERPITTLSGGNQQKAVLARWLAVAPTVLSLSEPTAGIDIGARTAIFAQLRRRAEEGLAVLMSSSDAEDLIAVCDRVLVLRDGSIVAEFDRQEISKQAIVAAMEGAYSEQA